MGAMFGTLHPSFKGARQRADEYLPPDKCLKSEAAEEGKKKTGST